MDNNCPKLTAFAHQQIQTIICDNTSVIMHMQTLNNISEYIPSKEFSGGQMDRRMDTRRYDIIPQPFGQISEKKSGF